MSNRKPLNYSTTVSARRSVAQCQDMLADAGAGAVATTLEQGQPSGLSFQMHTARGIQTFHLPVSWQRVHKQLQGRDSGVPPRFRTEQHARDVAWRVIKDWLEAQLALIATEMVSMDEVMMPYLQVESGVSLYQALTEGRAAITAASLT